MRHLREVFRQMDTLRRHKQNVHDGLKHKCTKCSKTYARNCDRVKHETTCAPVRSTYTCAHCPTAFKSVDELRAHGEQHHRKREAAETADEPSSKRPKSNYVQCRRCTARFQNRRDLHAHNMAEHFQGGAGNLQPEPWGANSPPWEKENGTVDNGLKKCYQTNRALILEPHNQTEVLSIFNAPVPVDITVEDIAAALNELYNRQTHAFKINMTFGMILRHIETGEYRYFRPFSNQAIFEAPIFIARRSDISDIIERLRTMDILAELFKNRPDTKWVLELITNIRFQVFSTNFILGAARTPLPSYIRNRKCIISLEKDNHGLEYTDKLCAFRSMSLYLYKDLTHTSELFVQWKEYLFSHCETDIREVSLTSFKGVQLTEFTHFEACFGTNVHIFNLQENGIAIPVFKSTGRYDNSVYLNLFKNHLSYIQNLDQYSNQYECTMCRRIFDQLCHLKVHSKICDNKTKFIYPGGFFSKTKTVFEELEIIGIDVQQKDRYFPYFAVYDFESILEKIADSDGKLQFTHRHIPVSVSICSNLPGLQQAQCFVDRDLDSLLVKMLESLNEIQRRSTELAEDQWGWV